MIRYHFFGYCAQALRSTACARLAVLATAILCAFGICPVGALAADAPVPIAWSAETGVPLYSVPRIAGGRIYLTSGQDKGPTVFALSAATGKILWRYATGGGIPEPPAVSSTQIFVASDFGQQHFMRALDAYNGTLVWEYARNQPPECMCSHPSTLESGLLLAQTDGHSLYAFQPVGTVRSRRIWQFAGDGAKLTKPVVADGIVVFGSADHALYALDTKTRAVRWVAKRGYGFVARPRIVDGIVLAGNRGGTLHA